MNSTEKQTNISTEDNQKNQNETVFVSNCEKTIFSCNNVAEVVNTSKMGELIWKTFVLNQKLLEITYELWSSLLSVINKEEIAKQKWACYEILDAKNCNSLNMNFDFFNNQLIGYQKMHTKSWEHEDYVDLQQKFMSSIEAFLALSLPPLELDIEHIILKVQNPKEGDKIYTSLSKKNVAPVLNEAIFNFTRRLREEIVRFKLVDVPLDLRDRKGRIEYLIDRAYRIKQRYLKKLNISSSTTTIKPILSSDNSFYEADTTPKPLLTQTSKITDNPLTTEQTKVCNCTDFVLNNDLLEKNISVTQSTELENDVNSRITTNWIIIGSVFSVLFFVIILIVYCVLKYKSRKKLLKRNDSVVFKNEKLTNESKIFSLKV